VSFDKINKIINVTKSEAGYRSMISGLEAKGVIEKLKFAQN
jgi:hypothetical protein